MRWNEIIKEEFEDYTGPKIFGHPIPDWSREDERTDAAYFAYDRFYSPAQVIYRDGKVEVWFHSEDQHYCDSTEQAEAVLQKYQFTEFDDYGGFSPPSATNESQDIIAEGSDFHCPECDDYLGKESEVFQDGSAYCGRCGWESKSRKASRSSSAPAPAKPTVAAKPTPKSKQTLVKKSGDYEARIYPGRKTAGLYYLANKDKLDNICKGEVRASETGGFIPTWYASNYHKFQLPAQPTMAAALNAIKAKHKKLLKAKPGTKLVDLANES